MRKTNSTRRAKLFTETQAVLSALFFAMVFTGCGGVRKTEDITVPVFAVTVSQPANGRIEVNKEDGTKADAAFLKAVPKNVKLKFTLSADDGYKAVKLVIGTEEFPAGSARKICGTVSVTENLSVSGSTVRETVPPAEKTKLTKITLDGTDLTSLELENAAQGIGITKTFEKETVTVSAEVEAGGTIEYSENAASGTVNLTAGSAVVTITAKKSGKLDAQYKIILNKTEAKKIEVKSILTAVGFNEWGEISYGAFSAMTFDKVKKKWIAAKPSSGDLLAFKITAEHGSVQIDKVKVKLFEGTLKDGVVLYDTEKTKGLTAGVSDSGVLTFILDGKNCHQIPIKEFYKIEFFVDGTADTEAFIALN